MGAGIAFKKKMENSDPHFRTPSTTSIKVSWRMLKEPDPRSKPSYLPHTWEPLERRGQIEPYLWG